MFPTKVRLYSSCVLPFMKLPQKQHHQQTFGYNGSRRYVLYRLAAMLALEIVWPLQKYFFFCCLLILLMFVLYSKVTKH